MSRLLSWLFIGAAAASLGADVHLVRSSLTQSKGARLPLHGKRRHRRSRESVSAPGGDRVASEAAVDAIESEALAAVAEADALTHHVALAHRERKEAPAPAVAAAPGSVKDEDPAAEENDKGDESKETTTEAQAVEEVEEDYIEASETSEPPQRGKPSVKEQYELHRRRRESVKWRRAHEDMSRDEMELHDVEVLQDRIRRETQSAGLAEMLGSIKYDMYRLNNKVNVISAHLDGGVQLRKEAPEEQLVYPVSTEVMCVAYLTVLFFVVYTAAALCRLFTSCFSMGASTKAERCLQAASESVFFAPMLCVLFIAAKLRALQITKGMGGTQAWGQMAMQLCVWALLAQTLLVLAIPVFTGEAPRNGSELRAGSPLPTPSPGRDPLQSYFSALAPQPALRSMSPALAGLLLCMRCVASLALYSGVAVVMLAVYLMNSKTLWVENQLMWDDPSTGELEMAPPLSPALLSVLLLAFLFFWVHIIYGLVWSCVELTSSTGSPPWLVDLEVVFRDCSWQVDLAPMLGVILIAAKLSALQADPTQGRAHYWADWSFRGCAMCLLLMTLAAFCHGFVGFLNTRPWQETMTSLLSNQNPQHSASSLEDVVTTDKGQESSMQRVFMCIRNVMLCLLYCCALAVTFAVAWSRFDPDPLAPTLRCVVALSLAYFFVFLAIFFSKDCGLRCCDAANPLGSTVKVAPMLAVLFLAARMRAWQLSRSGSPQCWAQDAMYFATGALLVQVLLVLVVCATNRDVDVDGLGALVNMHNIRYAPGRFMSGLFQFLALLGLYGGCVVVVLSILTIRPETANCGEDGMTLHPEPVPGEVGYRPPIF